MIRDGQSDIGLYPYIEKRRKARAFLDSRGISLRLGSPFVYVPACQQHHAPPVWQRQAKEDHHEDRDQTTP